jgi:hypothetical protein
MKYEGHDREFGVADLSRSFQLTARLAVLDRDLPAWIRMPVVGGPSAA